MPHELVVEPQRVQDARLPQHDRVVECPAEREAALAEQLDFLQEAEGPRRRNLIDEGPLVEVDRLLLMAQERMIEADGVADLEAVGRIERGALVAVLHLNRLQNLHRLARCRLLAHAGILNQVDPRRGAAVHDRHFRMAELDAHVVDREAVEGREQVLDGLNRRLIGHQQGLQLLVAAQMGHRGGNLDAEVGAQEPDAVANRSRLQSQRHAFAGEPGGHHNILAVPPVLAGHFMHARVARTIPQGF